MKNTKYFFYFLFIFLSSLLSAQGKKLPAASMKSVDRIFSSGDAGESVASLALDGDKNTRWVSVGTEKAFLGMKFKKKSVLRTLRITWETASAEEYEIEVSEDGDSWQKVYSVTAGQQGESREISFEPVECLYFRISCTKKASEWDYSIYEIEINPLLLSENNRITIGNITASGTENDDASPDKMTDGDIYTRWASVWEDGQWVLLTLGNAEEISGMKVVWESAAAKKYAVYCSADGEKYKKYADISDGKEAETRLIELNTPPVRYVKLDLKTRSTSWGFSIFEVELFRK